MVDFSPKKVKIISYLQKASFFVKKVTESSDMSVYYMKISPNRH